LFLSISSGTPHLVSFLLSSGYLLFFCCAGESSAFWYDCILTEFLVFRSSFPTTICNAWHQRQFHLTTCQTFPSPYILLLVFYFIFLLIPFSKK
jgi:hypothetical protein